MCLSDSKYVWCMRASREHSRPRSSFWTWSTSCRITLNRCRHAVGPCGIFVGPVPYGLSRVGTCCGVGDISVFGTSIHTPHDTGPRMQEVLCDLACMASLLGRRLSVGVVRWNRLSAVRGPSAAVFLSICSPALGWLCSTHPESGPIDKFVDGSMEADLPMQQISELFNINHFIVSQVCFFLDERFRFHL